MTFNRLWLQGFLVLGMLFGGVAEGYVRDDGDLIRAMLGRRKVHFLEASQLVVTQVLPDDRQGRTHQKFLVRTSNGGSVLIVYNTDLCPRVPVRIGDRISVGGEYIWNNAGGLMHWTHFDPRRHRPSGYVELNGYFYCQRG